VKSLIKIFTILVFGIAFSIQASFAFQNQSVANSNQKQEFKKIEYYGLNAALLEHSRVLSPINSQTLPISLLALFTLISSFSFVKFNPVSIYQKRLKTIRQQWLWLILFPFHSFY
jgi:hypothetical protein